MPRIPSFPLRLTPLLLALAVGLVACPGPDLFTLPAWGALVENVAGGASGATPCTGGLWIKSQAEGYSTESDRVPPGRAWEHSLPSAGPARPAGAANYDAIPPTIVDAYCDTGSGVYGHSRFAVPFSEDRILRVTATDGKAHDYVLQAPGPVIEVLR